MKIVKRLDAISKLDVFVISSFDLDNWKDKIIYTSILDMFFGDNGNCVFLGYREDSLLFKGETLMLRDKIPKMVKAIGNYNVVYDKKKTWITTISEVPNGVENRELLIDMWRYYYSLCIFSINEQYSWNDLITFGDNLFIQDNYSIYKILDLELFDRCLIKGLNDDEIIISTIKEDGFEELLKSSVFNIEEMVDSAFRS